MVEIIRSRLTVDTVDPDHVIAGITTMKDGTEMQIIAPAVGFLGPYTWFPDFRDWAAKRANVLPDAKWRQYEAGNITLAHSLKESVCSDSHARISLLAVLALEPLAMGSEEVKSLDLTNHSSHGTASDMVMYIGPSDHFQPIDQDVLANWRRAAVENEARANAKSGTGQTSSSDESSTRAKMRVAYSLGNTKEGNRERQLETRTRYANYVADALAKFGKPWTQLPKGRADWAILRAAPRAYVHDEDFSDSSVEL